MKNFKLILIVIIVFFVGISIYFFIPRGGSKINSQATDLPATSQNNTSNTDLAPQVNEEGGVSVEVKPIDLRPGEQAKFEISFNTHQGNLDFDLTKISILTDDQGNQYLPLEWQGGQGGHHLSGTLIFSVISEQAKKLKLALENIYDVKEREFSWILN